jgi:hypothetical protein
MVSFSVFENGAPATKWPLGVAHLIGPDEVPTQGEVRFDPATGLVTCEKPASDAAGLVVQFPVSFSGTPLGLLTLRTSLLPDRSDPYLLSLELARHRIMLVLNKLEDWGLFDLPADNPIISQLEAARGEFTRALVSMCHRDCSTGTPRPDPASLVDADLHARAALGLALDASEKLAGLHAAEELRGRLDGSTFVRAQERAEAAMSADRLLPDGAVKDPDGGGVILPGAPQIGCAINPATFSPELARVVGGCCDFVSMPMRWVEMEPTEGKYAFGRTDKWIEWAIRTAKLPVHAGPLICFSELCVPEWLYIWEHDYETLRELVYEHIKTIVTRYRKTITRWTVCSGLHMNESFALNLERMMDLTRMCALLVKKLHPAGKVQIEIDRPWGEYFAANKRSMPPKLYGEMIQQAGIAIDAYALKIQMGQPAPGRSTRDMAVLSDLLDRYAELEKPLAVTAIGVPSQPIPAGAGPPRGRDGPPPPPLEAGHWHTPWSPETQSRWLTQALMIAAGKPYISSVCWQELYDPPASLTGPGNGADMPFGGLISESGMLKPAVQALGELRATLRGRAPAPPGR